MSAVRVLLVDDQPLVRAGLRRILSPRSGFDVVGECNDGDEVIDALAAATPDVIVMDIRMPNVDGIEATSRVVAADGPPVLVLTTFDDDDLLASALRAGAQGFCLKDAEGEELHSAVRAVASGAAWLDPGVCGRVLRVYRGAIPPEAVLRRPSEAARLLNTLTPKELEVLTLVARGMSNTEIANSLSVGEGTVKTHIGRIFTKLCLRDRAGAIVFAFDNGVVCPRI